jgi:hypothetical protein
MSPWIVALIVAAVLVGLKTWRDERAYTRFVRERRAAYQAEMDFYERRETER